MAFAFEFRGKYEWRQSRGQSARPRGHGPRQPRDWTCAAADRAFDIHRDDLHFPPHFNRAHFRDARDRARPVQVV